MTDRFTLIASLTATIERTLGALLPPRSRVALLDFPAYTNVGDSAIWLGERAALAALGVGPPCYTSDIETYDRDELARRVGRGSILLSGGGNLGDLWERHQRFREDVLGAFPENPVVQLPQSIHFHSRAALARARRVLDGHPRLTLCVRERRSLELARNEFRTPSVLCPDMAFCLGPLERPAPATRPVLWLSRSDIEALPGRGPEPEPSSGAGRVDWLDEAPSLLTRIHARLGQRLARRAWPRALLRAALSATYGPLARRRLARGCGLLAAAGTVVTDRLHGHILCLLLGIPHVLLDNSYGKVSSFYETWTRDSDLVRWGGSGVEAVALAARDPS
jgi:exopolysaccharide biosynthesis protein PssK